jgi:hypothetical protein
MYCGLATHQTDPTQKGLDAASRRVPSLPGAVVVVVGYWRSRLWMTTPSNVRQEYISLGSGALFPLPLVSLSVYKGAQLPTADSCNPTQSPHFGDPSRKHTSLLSSRSGFCILPPLTRCAFLPFQPGTSLPAYNPLGEVQ